jgi:L-rhamnose-H+ transport protein
MQANPLAGVVLHWLGGASSASFYVPYTKVRGWPWEIVWLTGGAFSWVIEPWLLALLLSHRLFGVLGSTPAHTLFWCYAFGALWGVGGLTFGLAIRYLGLSLGMAVALGFTTAFGTLVPPLFDGSFASRLLAPTGGRIVLAGIAITLAGIAIVAVAGRARDRARGVGGARSDFARGIAIAVFSGVMSSCFAYGLAAGAPIRAAALAAGTGDLWQGLPVLCVVLAGGFTTNALWCGFLIVRNRSARRWAEADGRARNIGLCALGGLLWYFQFFFYTMGESQMGRYGFSSWTLHMASIIVFSTLWGFALSEWRFSSSRTRSVVRCGIGVLVLATVVIGWGNALSGPG